MLRFANKCRTGLAGNDIEALQKARRVAPSSWFLSPGIGAQGGRADLALLQAQGAMVKAYSLLQHVLFRKRKGPTMLL